jgi:hypothetical protein
MTNGTKTYFLIEYRGEVCLHCLLIGFYRDEKRSIGTNGLNVTSIPGR